MQCPPSVKARSVPRFIRAVFTRGGGNFLPGEPLSIALTLALRVLIDRMLASMGFGKGVMTTFRMAEAGRTTTKDLPPTELVHRETAATLRKICHILLMRHPSLQSFRH